MPSRARSIASALARARHAPRPLDRLPGALTVLGHRGASSSLPENTMAAFEACASAGFGIELDVGTTADGALVVLHDEAVERTTDGVGRLSDLTLAQVRALDAGAWRGSTFAGLAVPTLDEVLDAFAGRVPLDIELKTDPAPERLASRVVGLLRQHRAIDAVFVTSFDPFVLGALAAAEPAILRGQIVGTLRGSTVPRWQRAILRRVGLRAIARPDLIAAEEPLLTAAFLGGCRRAGWPVLAWTVDDPVRARALREAGVLGVISNEPVAMAAALAG